jgi:uncharacterized membrane protein
MRQRWEKRSEQLSGALWVLPLLFVVGALVLGSTLSQITIEPGSPLDPVLFRGNAEEARRVLLGVATTVVGVLALVIGLTVVALQVASNRYSPRLLRDFLRDRTAQVVLGLFVATFTYNAAGLYTVGIPRGGSAGQYGRLAVTVGLCLLFVCIGALVYFVDRMVHSIQIDEVLAKISGATAHAIAKEPAGIGRTSSGAAATEPRYAPPPALEGGAPDPTLWIRAGHLPRAPPTSSAGTAGHRAGRAVGRGSRGCRDAAGLGLADLARAAAAAAGAATDGAAGGGDDRF